MMRALVPLWGALSLVAVDQQVTATPPTGEAGASPAVTCEQPTTSPIVSPPKSETDMASMMAKWSETMSEIEAWWRERVEFLRCTVRQAGACHDERSPRSDRSVVARADRSARRNPGKAGALHHERSDDPAGYVVARAH